MQPQDIALYTGLTLTILNIFDRVSILKEKAKSHRKGVMGQKCPDYL
jgi:hypothetical protein